MGNGTQPLLVEPHDELASLKTQFLGSLNHELRTPLTGILGMTDLLLETRLDAEQQDYAASIRACADQLLVLFDKTLEFSDLASGRAVLARREFRLPESVRGAVYEHLTSARAKGLRLVCRMCSGLPEVAVGDAARLQRLLTHLVENAVKFTEFGRVEVIAAGRIDGRRLELRLDVSDTGIGIPPERLPLVFEAFRQLDSGPARAYNGLGLGLSLAQKLASLMGGALAVDSAPGRGSVFSAIIPLELPSGERSAAGD